MAEELAETDGDGGEALVAVVPLTPKEESFCRFYGDPESPHYSRPTAAAIAAGYAEKSAWSTAWKLRHRSHVQARLMVFQKAAFAAAGKVLTDLEHTRLAALEKGDLAVAARCSELAGKHLGLFLENSVLTLSQDTLPRYDARAASDTRIILALLRQDRPVAIESPHPVVNPAAATSPAAQDGSGGPPTPVLDRSIEGPARTIPEQIAALEQARAPRTTRQERT